ncbi:uncharacterized protein LOC112098886 [Citrus clementina]|uniref:uncharacterized protein LOC112098886 n=1 Tax=Citrus clementina TaxID=85681 RepID=UPI000CECF5EF|nr:uncharacterized protein LOC112098886 [Citrus x clementina]
MKTKELIKRCRAIRLSDEEYGRVTFMSKMKAKREIIVAGCLIGKVLNTRGVNSEGLKMAMQRVWKTSREVKIESLGDNVFMFKFGSEADKRSIIAGGPWHFDRALMVLTEPVGIGAVKKQDFRHLSFWVQIHDVPIMCMTKEMATVLGEVVGKVEEVETDAAGEYIGQFLRMRISVDVTKLLKKIMLEQEGEDDEDILIRVMYERLLDFCFCCGRIRHQYRECVHYKSQSKDEMAYGPWLKAMTITKKLKQSRMKDRWDSQPSNSHANFATPTKNTKNQGTAEIEQGRERDMVNEDGSSRHLLDSGMASTTRDMGKLQKVVGTQLMMRDTDYREPICRGSENEKVTGKDTEH